MKKIFTYMFILQLLVATGCNACSSSEKGAPVIPNQKYTNPVVALSLPDPTIIKAQDGHFYLYATENTRNTPIYRSDNLVAVSYTHLIVGLTSNVGDCSTIRQVSMS